MNKIWVLATTIGLLFNVLMMYQYLGISVFVLTALGIFTIYYTKKKTEVTLGKKFYLISGYMIVLSLNFAITTVGVVRFFTGLILIILMMSLHYSEQTFRWPKWFLQFINYFFGGLSYFTHYFRHSSKVVSGKGKLAKQIILGIILAIPILAVAAGLLLSADAVFRELFEQLFDQMNAPEIGEGVWRVIIFFLMTPTIYGILQFMAHKNDKKKTEELLGETSEEMLENTVLHSEPKKGGIEPAVSGTVLVLLNMLYLVFAYVQIRFLFGSDTIVIEGYDFAKYAREGFFELVTLSILNTLGILFIHRFTKTHIFNKVALTITALCTYIMMASSFYKMFLYESTYGYTQLRLYVYIILVFMMIFMALITLNIWQTSYPVIEWAIVIGLCYFLVVSYVNVDAIIVERNLERYEQIDELDFRYLTTLSDDAMPSLIDYMTNNPEKFSAYELEMRMYETRVMKMITEDEERSFFEFNIRHYRGVEAYRNSGEVFE